MRVFKGVDLDNCATHGRGKMKYIIGKKMTADKAMEMSTGLHWAEYVMVCVGYQNLGQGHIYLADAKGEFSEKGDTTGCSTELTLLKELTRQDIAVEALMYMKLHPEFKGWKHHSPNCEVEENKAECQAEGIAIARGIEPVCKGGPGAVLGWMNETDGSMRMGIVGTRGIQPEKWYRMVNGIVSEVGDEIRESIEN